MLVIENLKSLFFCKKFVDNKVDDLNIRNQSNDQDLEFSIIEID